jgi:hypothetical protein
VREHDALGLAGRARGVDQRCQALGREPGEALLEAVGERFCGFALAQEVLPGRDPVSVGWGGRAVEQHRAAQAGQLGASAAQLLELRGVLDHRDDGAAVAQDVGRLLGGRGRVDAGGHPAGRHRSEIGEQPFTPVGRQDCDHAAFNETFGEQGAGDAAHGLRVLAPVERVAPLALETHQCRSVAALRRVAEQAMHDGVRGLGRAGRGPRRRGLHRQVAGL